MGNGQPVNTNYNVICLGFRKIENPILPCWRRQIHETRCCPDATIPMPLTESSTCSSFDSLLSPQSLQIDIESLPPLSSLLPSDHPLIKESTGNNTIL